MLTIRSAQMEVLAQSQAPRINEEIGSYLREHHSLAVGVRDPPTLTRDISIGVQRARGWGLSTPRELGLFVALMFEFGPLFDTHVALRRTLEDPSRSPGQRLAALEAALTDDEWDQLADSADQQPWEA